MADYACYKDSSTFNSRDGGGPRCNMESPCKTTQKMFLISQITLPSDGQLTSWPQMPIQIQQLFLGIPFVVILHAGCQPLGFVWDCRF